MLYGARLRSPSGGARNENVAIPAVDVGAVHDSSMHDRKHRQPRVDAVCPSRENGKVQTRGEKV